MLREKKAMSKSSEKDKKIYLESKHMFSGMLKLEQRNWTKHIFNTFRYLQNKSPTSLQYEERCPFSPWIPCSPTPTILMSKKKMEVKLMSSLSPRCACISLVNWFWCSMLLYFNHYEQLIANCVTEQRLLSLCIYPLWS